ncbi:FIST N-terminal domain-containing protein [Asanoa sp. WMMD1127]|uniref:FIST signal transduction protein n=1 Tax=Asanoa sp. WMMD1127 TaxID=3016107 RepID=UPI00241771C8|nr:FIST N-terminal domain-containing protein [Asanoa sp. WMMD1127]MDG4826198.1 FIST N-terminal domain-containing protein [Asanoa sp. WMMD1127]
MSDHALVGVSTLTSTKARRGVGTGEGPDARLATEKALGEALRPLEGQQPDLILVYASVRYDLPTVLKTVNAAAGSAVVAGATSSGQLQSGRLTEPGDGVAVLALAGGGYRFGLGHATGLQADATSAGRALARAALDAAGPVRSPHEAVLIFSDGLAGDQQELLNGIHKVTGFQIPVIGGAAADDRRLAETFVFAGDRVLRDAAVAIWIGSDRPLRVVGGHGWRPTSLPLMLSGVEGQIVKELGGRPALEVFWENFRPRGGPDTTLYERAGGYHSEHAFGLIQPDGSLLIRGAFIDADGKLRTFSPMPPYSAVQVVSCEPDDLLEVGEQVVESVVGDEEPAVVLVFDCVARLDILGKRGHEEARRLQEAAGGAPTFGYYTYGEFARTTGVAGYHNATIAAMAL